MKYIPDDNLSLPDGWLERAHAARDLVSVAPPETRSELIDQNSSIWRDLRETLARLSNGKCWYCETKENRSDHVVDHFRPKNRVAECPNHTGYWWLAFDVSNYRYSCTFCNSLRKSERHKVAGGKADHFPIVDESSRALGPTDPIHDELPCLLDPRNRADPLLLTFQDDGTAVPRFDKENALLKHKRAAISIKVYHLNHPEIKEARFAIAEEIKKLVEEGDRAFLRQEGLAVAAIAARESFDSIVRRIRLMIDEKAEYSRAAMATLLSYKTKPWIEAILQDLS